MKALKTLFATLLLLCAPTILMAQGVEKIGVQGLRNLIDSSKGRVLIVNYWATWCSPCVKEFPGLMNVRREFAESDLSIVGISVDYNPKLVENFIKQNKVNFPIFLDDGSIGQMMDIGSIPRTLIYDRQGKKILDHLGFIPEESFRHVVARLLGTP
ncbi:TlpA family protein disulfide reductase [Desulfomicrobium escambiense]|uniref:TlpA family protein disulfide reductase n=1 Tax=Desulfomicrobium escambiense TaxID=29503 RepID=UPI0004120D6D|nr:TlpA disulfide reductase family protein [Desulfomicrobium escambiense]